MGTAERRPASSGVTLVRLGRIAKATLSRSRRSVPAEPLDRPGDAPPEPQWSACYAPHSSMYFDQFGKVRACCQNTGVYLGDVNVQTLREVWESAEAEQMRAALEHDDFSVGCDFCEWQVREGNEDILFARSFDHLRPDEQRPRWPRQMEFSLTNTCNLQCAMCNGDWSSTIRAKREERDPLPPAYGDAFYEQLEAFLPHLELARFLGGEPFLGKEPLRVMEMLAALAEPPEVNITTNGTIWTSRVQRIIEALRPTIVVSIDGASAPTYESIRIGARFDEVMVNLDRFCDAVGSSSVSIAHCLMTTNWHEFSDLLQIAEERDLFVGVNVVRFPAEHSLYQLDEDQLRTVVTTMQATAVTLTGPRLKAWNGHVAALAHRLEVISAEDAELGPQHGLPGAPGTARSASDPVPVEIASRPPAPAWMPFPRTGRGRREGDAPLLPAERPVLTFAIDAGGRVAILGSDPHPDLPVPVDDLDGASVGALEDRLLAAVGREARWEWPEIAPEDRTDLVRIRTVRPRGQPQVTFASAAQRDDEGTLTGARCRLSVIPAQA